MKLKTIRMNPDRHARLKALAHEAGFKTMGKYLESVLDAPAKKVGALEPKLIHDAINVEVRQRIRGLEEELVVAQGEVAFLRSQERPTTKGEASTNPEEDATLYGLAAPHTLEDCARTMINMLPESTRNFAYEVCEHILHIQPSQLIHGHLMNAADSSLLQSPHIDPSWEQRKVEEKAGKSTCEWHECRQPFEPGHYGQRYCGNICGGKAATEMLPKPQIKTRPILDAPGMQNLIAV